MWAAAAKEPEPPSLRLLLLSRMASQGGEKGETELNCADERPPAPAAARADGVLDDAEAFTGAVEGKGESAVAQDGPACESCGPAGESCGPAGESCGPAGESCEREDEA